MQIAKIFKTVCRLFKVKCVKPTCCPLTPKEQAYIANDALVVKEILGTVPEFIVRE